MSQLYEAMSRSLALSSVASVEDLLQSGRELVVVVDASAEWKRAGAQAATSCAARALLLLSAGALALAALVQAVASVHFVGYAALFANATSANVSLAALQLQQSLQNLTAKLNETSWPPELGAAPPDLGT